MTIQEAMEKYELDAKVGVRTYDGRSLQAIQLLARELMNEHDDTPLTLETAKEVLGEPTTVRKNRYAAWKELNLTLGLRCGYLQFGVMRGIDKCTIGQLRTLARLLRGGA